MELMKRGCLALVFVIGTELLVSQGAAAKNHKPSGARQAETEELDDGKGVTEPKRGVMSKESVVPASADSPAWPQTPEPAADAKSNGERRSGE